MQPRFSFVVSGLLLIGACGGDDGGGGTDGPPGGGDGPGVTCRTPENLGAVTPTTQEALSESAGSGTPDLIELDADLDGTASPDQLSIQLYKGYGPFTVGEIVPGTYPLTGADAQRSTCGACVLLFTDVLEGVPQGTPYLASGGELIVTAVSPNFTGSLSGVTLTHVNIDQTTLQSAPHPDGCTTSVASMSFDATVVAQKRAP